MPQQYTIEELNKRALQARDDLNKIKGYLTSSPNQDAQSLVPTIELIVRNGNYRGSGPNELGSIINNKYIDVKYYPTDGLDDKIKQLEENRIKRLKSYYQWLTVYDRKNKKKTSPTDPKLNNASNQKQKKTLQQMTAIKKRSNSITFKNPTQVLQDFANQQDNRFKSTIANFEKRWVNNQQKVGNTFTNEYEALKQDIEQLFLNVTSPYQKIARMYNFYIPRYGFENLIASALECAMKQIDTTALGGIIDSVQKAIDDAAEVADNVEQTVALSVNIADNLIGIAEEARDRYDATKKMREQHKDYKNNLKKNKIPTVKDAKKNTFLNKFVNVLLPVLTSQLSNVLEMLLDNANACTERQPGAVNIPTIIDDEAFLAQLNDAYGLNKESSQDYLDMLVDISGFLTPVEICKLFQGSAPEYVLDLVLYFNGVFYKNIAIQLDTREKLGLFFIAVGTLVDEEFCLQVELSSIRDFCFEEGTYSSDLRTCLFEKDPNLLNKLREAYEKTKRKQVKDLIEFSFLPLELKGEQAAINNIFASEKKRQTLEPLLDIANDYEAKYNESLGTLSKTFVKLHEREELAEPFISGALGKVYDRLSDEQKSRLQNSVPSKIIRHERYINPGINRSLFLSEGDIETSFLDNDRSFVVRKKYNTFRIAAQGLRGLVDTLGSLQQTDVADINMDFVYNNPALQFPNYGQETSIRYTLDKGKYLCVFRDQQESYRLHPGDRYRKTGKLGKALDADGNEVTLYYPAEDNVIINEKYSYMLRKQDTRIIQRNTRSEPVFDSYNKFLSKLGDKTKVGTNERKYKKGALNTYNRMVNICLNSVFAKKIPIGPLGPSDNSKISGLEVVKLSKNPLFDDLGCSDVVKNFGLIKFDALARQMAETQINDIISEGEDEDDVREKYFNLLMMFKSHIMSFITKAIFLFSEFNFEPEDVDDSMIDFIYVDLFNAMTKRDIELDSLNFEYEDLTEDEKNNFVDKIYTFKDVLSLLQDYKKQKEQINKKVQEKKQAKQDFPKNEKNLIEKLQEQYLKLPDLGLYSFLEDNTTIKTLLPKGEVEGGFLFTLPLLLENIEKTVDSVNKKEYNKFISELKTIQEETVKLSKDIAEALLDPDIGKPYWEATFPDRILGDRYLTEDKATLADKLGMYGGGLDDRLDDLLNRIEQWNKDWADMHNKYIDIKTYNLPGRFKHKQRYAAKNSSFPSRKWVNSFGAEQQFDWRLDTSLLGWGNFSQNYGHTVLYGLGLATSFLLRNNAGIYYYQDIKDWAEKAGKAKEAVYDFLEKSEDYDEDIISLQNKSATLSLIISELEEFDSQQKNLKYNLTYDLTKFLLHYHNKNYPQLIQEDFCPAIRNLIRFEISNTSKVLKDIIYTPLQKGGKLFGIKDRIAENDLNMFYSEQDTSQADITEDDVKDQIFEILSNKIIGGSYPYYNTSNEIDRYLSDEILQQVTSQLGEQFFLTKVGKFDPNKDKTTTVKVYNIFAPTRTNFKEPPNREPTLDEQQDFLKKFIPSQNQKKISLEEKEFIKKIFRKMKISDENILDFETGKDRSLIEKEVTNLYNAMDTWRGTDEDEIVRILTKNKPEIVVQIEIEFNRRYRDLEGWGTLRESLEIELNDFGDDLYRKQAFGGLDFAAQKVREQGGLRVGSFNFVKYPDFNKIKGDPFDTQAEKGGKKYKKDILYDKAPINSATPGPPGGIRYITSAEYPVSAISQFFERTNYVVGDYKHRESGQWRDAVPNREIRKYLSSVSRQIAPEYISLIDHFKTKDVIYDTKPVIEFTVSVESYKTFVTNYKKKYPENYKRIAKSIEKLKSLYIDHCLKEQIVEKALDDIFLSENKGAIYLNAFPINKFLSHIAINMNNYVKYINNLSTAQSTNILPISVSPISSLEDFSFFNASAAASLGLTVAGASLTAADINRIEVGSLNLSVGDIISLTNSFDFSIDYLKTVIRYFLGHVEQADYNIRLSKQMADGYNQTIRQIYSKTRTVANLSQQIGKIWGAEFPQDQDPIIPSPSQLDAQFKGIRYLFNLPVTPFAIGNLFLIPPTSWSNWISYVALENILIILELLEDYGTIEQLREYLFGNDRVSSSFFAADLNYLTECEVIRENNLRLNPIVKENQKTLGGEYLLPDGREYIGEYHIHKDGTVMVGGKHPKDQPTIILSPYYERDDF